MTDLRYPIGRFAFDGDVTLPTRTARIEQIAQLPGDLKDAVAGLSPNQLATPYRPAGWTVQQVVHHVPDSHLNAYIRFKLALTEDTPTIKPYAEDKWAELSDSLTLAPEVSLTLLTALHARWVTILRAMKTEDFQRTFVHPEHGRPLTLDEVVAMYAWHGRHHVAHITSLRDREGWR